MEGRLTPRLALTKPDASSRLDAGVANARLAQINRDLDLIDAAIGALQDGGGGAGGGMTQAEADLRYVQFVGGSVMTGALAPESDFGTDLGTATRRFDTVRAAFARLSAELGLNPPFTASNDPLWIKVGGEPFLRHTVGPDGLLRWGGGALERDVSLGRTGVGTLGINGKAVAADPAAGNSLVWNAGGFYVAPGGVPGPHHATHEPGGSDPLAVDAAAATGSLRTLGTGAQQAAAGTHSHTAPTVPACRVYHTGNLSVPSGALTALQFNSERFDTDAIHDPATNPTRLTCKTAGTYHVFGSFEMQAGGTGFRQIMVLLNGTTAVAVLATPPGTAVRLAVSTVYALAVNDYVELCATQDSGGGLAVLATGNYSPEFGLVRVA